jgi:hypothetical protein
MITFALVSIAAGAHAMFMGTEAVSSPAARAKHFTARRQIHFTLGPLLGALAVAVKMGLPKCKVRSSHIQRS